MTIVEILNSEGEVINKIVAEPDVAEELFPGMWRLVPEEVTPVVNPTEWLIDVGPFFDRFGAAKMAVLTSSDSAVKAILADLQVRKWIDLQREDVAQGLEYVGSVVPAVTSTLQTAILTSPVSEAENLALRKLYFS